MSYRSMSHLTSPYARSSGEPDDPRASADRLLFATDYPHWDFDSPAQALPRAMPQQMREAIKCDNALALYGLPR
jgi:hypothetical protein